MIGSVVEYTGERPSFMTQHEFEMQMRGIGAIQQANNHWQYQQQMNQQQQQQVNFGAAGSDLHISPKPSTVTNNQSTTVKQPVKENKTMLGTISSDLKKFIVEHKSTIYVVAVLILLDHFLFQGSFRDRLHGLMNKMLGKVEALVEQKDNK